MMDDAGVARDAKLNFEEFERFMKIQSEDTEMNEDVLMGNESPERQKEMKDE
jgi:hypothetical protein